MLKQHGLKKRIILKLQRSFVIELEENFDLIVVGGGASGFMAAITAAEGRDLSIAVLEETSKTLEKVRISGGGRCNVSHACWETKELARNYPRGEKALLGAFSRFSTGDAIDWFEERGLEFIEIVLIFEISTPASERQ